MVISYSFIGAITSYQWLLVPILLVAILLMVISGYWWILVDIIFMLIGGY